MLLARVLWGSAEAAVTLGLVVLLLVVHQLWWTNREARAGAERQVHALEEEWGRAPGADTEPSPPPEEGASSAPEQGAGHADGRSAPPRRDQAYAVIRIPRIGVTAPIAQGIGKSGVLNRGYVGHYPGTAQPGREGNFALAGHRNTHGEPFRYINRLRPGDVVRVDTREGRFTYRIAKTLPQTSAADGSVIDAVPRSSVRRGYGFDERGSYITLTTCTPEYTSRYRLVVWGRLERAEARGS
ncbi:class E sortase [Streptomyces sp. NPDC048639]|uniref:class E sortase n=1 Tax=Streptomyces sp. NPDC048639 TaxID=3365581 RepID=UPI003723C45F